MTAPFSAFRLRDFPLPRLADGVTRNTWSMWRPSHVSSAVGMRRMRITYAMPNSAPLDAKSATIHCTALSHPSSAAA
jgi:hypothetical protein